MDVIINDVSHAHFTRDSGKTDAQNVHGKVVSLEGGFQGGPMRWKFNNLIWNIHQ